MIKRIGANILFAVIINKLLKLYTFFIGSNSIAKAIWFLNEVAINNMQFLKNAQYHIRIGFES